MTYGSVKEAFGNVPLVWIKTVVVNMGDEIDHDVNYDSNFQQCLSSLI